MSVRLDDHAGYEALTQPCGVIDRGLRVIGASGADAADYLNGQLTCDVNGLCAEDGAAPAC